MSRVLVTAFAIASSMACLETSANAGINTPYGQRVYLQSDGSLMMDGKVVDVAVIKNKVGRQRVLICATPDIRYSVFQNAVLKLEHLNIPVGLISQGASR